ncbi:MULTISPECIES: endonuclease/exonuclease/phosphatase family protein [unclassified Rothia (in: high G+C Gram-positive bacteria)]|uniref:endonuclease/exonuclease/phosphatase family protein n=1 Tax=unclassified Rothia (in: high G+C Gram-positive bacteria) TaxID=2689056 RepID=UPI00195C3C36|nr:MULTISPECIES: endonuclease/exonuclease/phosphatase family protein [unclassified Rothia (in: high G+C Gram-positive bacteria)]MBM7051167.1 endonuclease/exonuclease/phosphatase family protein [Rothia sp. ZJ1223]QRZ62136.1 endonuclease/exonuclease/phosphatase family protein [Rothia sp. ZJ932]
MKILTLNTHSWVELHQIPKIKTLAKFIIDEDIDVVALQEVNQHQETLAISADEYYLSATERAVHHDNFGLLLAHFLKDLGRPYYWSWVDAHEAWNAYDEGVAVFSKVKPRQVAPIVMDDSYDYSQVWRRTALALEIPHADGSFWVASTHMNWWFIEDKYLFASDFASLDSQLRQLAGKAPVILAGDFNNDPETPEEGYAEVISRQWHDTYPLAKAREGEYTVHKKIAGWETATKAMRIDFIFTDQPLQVDYHRVVFADNSPEAISDHSGVLVDFDPQQLFN